MIKLKFYINKNKKKNKLKKVYFIKIKRKNNKINCPKKLFLGSYSSKTKLYIFLYARIIAYSKLGINFSKRFSLTSLFYLKRFLHKNIF